MIEPLVTRRRFGVSAASTVLAGGPLAALAEGASSLRPDFPNVNDFAQHLGSHFLVQHETGSAVQVDLIEAQPSRFPAPPGFRTPFSVVFRLPGHARLSQDIYEVKHASLGTLRLLLVPFRPIPQRQYLEAVFS